MECFFPIGGGGQILQRVWKKTLKNAAENFGLALDISLFILLPVKKAHTSFACIAKPNNLAYFPIGSL